MIPYFLSEMKAPLAVSTGDQRMREVMLDHFLLPLLQLVGQADRTQDGSASMSQGVESVPR